MNLYNYSYSYILKLPENQKESEMLRVRYHNAMFAVGYAAKRRGIITQSDFDNLAAALRDNQGQDCSCNQLESLSYGVGVDNGSIDAKAVPLSTINWANFLQFLTALLPIILQFISIINPPKPPVPPTPTPTPSLMSGNGQDECNFATVALGEKQQALKTLVLTEDETGTWHVAQLQD